jgi:hypothetical protein
LALRAARQRGGLHHIGLLKTEGRGRVPCAEGAPAHGRRSRPRCVESAADVVRAHGGGAWHCSSVRARSRHAAVSHEGESAKGLGSMRTSPAGSRYGSGRKTTALIVLNMAVFMPTPTASVRIATAARVPLSAFRRHFRLQSMRIQARFRSSIATKVPFPPHTKEALARAGASFNVQWSAPPDHPPAIGSASLQRACGERMSSLMPPSEIADHHLTRS